jgi:hypothetical protein
VIQEMIEVIKEECSADEICILGHGILLLYPYKHTEREGERALEKN